MSFGDFLADFYEHLLQVLGCIGDKSDASQASAGHPRLCASSGFALRDVLDVCLGCPPGRSSCAGVRSCSAKLGSCCASVPST